MKIVVDTNIVMDVLANREPFIASSEPVFTLVANSAIQAAITANTVTDIAYLLHKHCRNTHTVRTSLTNLITLFDVIEVSKDTCLAALKLPMADYEDALLAECARRWGADAIISRNIKDFCNSPIPAITPDEFLQQPLFPVSPLN